jgi:hypothetical protein
MALTTTEVVQLTDKEIWDHCDHDVRTSLGSFIREFNKREWSVRIGKTHESFDDYTQHGYTHREEFGTGFVVNGRPVPYFHPNRSFHDEIIWLNSNLYYNHEVSFTNRLVNSAIVKFYGPSRTLDIITGTADDLAYLTRTGSTYVDFDRLRSDAEYEYVVMRNIELASYNKQQLWGTTELRTSLQKSSRDHARLNPTPIDIRGVICPRTGATVIPPNSASKERKMRTSDMIAWIKSLSTDWVNFYSTKPDMEKSYQFLTSYPGIGPYYGYHFSSNLARMPGVGSAPLIEHEHGSRYALLRDRDADLSHGNLDENADYVVAGPGACATLKSLWNAFPINPRTTMRMILAIRDNQEKYFDISSEMDYKYLTEASELGRFTTFGIEIGCCQFNVFNRLKDSPSTAANRANAPISKEAGKGGSTSLESFFD